MKRCLRLSLVALLIGSITGACATFGKDASARAAAPDSRNATIARAALWNATNVAAMNLKEGPRGAGAFPFRALVECNYLDKKLDGDSPKFACVIGNDDEVKVKFGGNNGEVFGEVLTTRLLWALGYNISIATWVGLIALMGLDAETGVFMLLFLDLAWDERVKAGLMRTKADLTEAIVHGAVKRVRPKLMTVLAAFLGLLPIMLSQGTGADMMKRVAAPMIGGLLTSFVLELLVYPPLYALWRERRLTSA